MHCLQKRVRELERENERLKDELIRTVTQDADEVEDEFHKGNGV